MLVTLGNKQLVCLPGIVVPVEIMINHCAETLEEGTCRQIETGALGEGERERERVRERERESAYNRDRIQIPVQLRLFTL